MTAGCDTAEKAGLGVVADAGVGAAAVEGNSGGVPHGAAAPLAAAAAACAICGTAWPDHRGAKRAPAAMARMHALRSTA